MRKSVSVLILFLLLSLASCARVGPATHKATLPSTPEATATDRNSTPTEVPTPTLIPTANSTASRTPGPTITPAPATYFYFEPGINPLTGLPLSDPARLNRRPVMVKVSNWPREGRPHAGLSQADIVFEYFIGHQMNRFLAIYYGEDSDVIGPVRSGRLVDAQLVDLYQGLLAYGNADPQVDEVLVDVLGERALAFNTVPCPAMCGESTHDATGVFANSAELTNYTISIGVDNTPPDLRGMYFQAEAPLGDGVGTLVHVEYADFSVMQWHYDPNEGRYSLWMEAQEDEKLILAPMTDRNTLQGVAFDNIVVMYAEYIEYASTLHDIKILEAGGDYQPALLFRDGVMNYGTWRVPEPDRPIIFESPEGGPLPFKPGRTWVVIVGMRSHTTQPMGGEWEIYFDSP